MSGSERRVTVTWTAAQAREVDVALAHVASDPTFFGARADVLSRARLRLGDALGRTSRHATKRAAEPAQDPGEIA